MGRIRTVKPEWLEDELMAFASANARVLSVALILLADDYGNGRCTSSQLAGRVFPQQPETDESLATSSRIFRESLAELSRIRFVGTYEVNGQHYFTIRNWDKHQKVDHPGKPLVPGPHENFWNVSRNPRENLAPDLDQDLDLEGSGVDHAHTREPACAKQEFKHPTQRCEDSFNVECPESIEFTDKHREIAKGCGEPLQDLWEDFRAKRRAKGVRAEMQRGWPADFEGWLRSFARYKREHDARAAQSGSIGRRAAEQTQPTELRLSAKDRAAAFDLGQRSRKAV